MNPLRVALIIHTCNEPEFLARVLSAVAGQSLHPDEVIVADDGSGEMTGKIFDRWQAAQPYRCEHVWQERSGARRARILNAAIMKSVAEYCIFLDGDSVPHPRFVEDHQCLAAAGHFVEAPRPTIGKVATRFFGREAFRRDRSRALIAFQVGGLSHAFRWPAPRRRIRADFDNLRGGNLAAWRADLESVNGFNEALTGTVSADAELAIRLMNRGVQRLAVAGRAVCYQLWQMPGHAGSASSNPAVLDQLVREQATRCGSGLDGHR